MILSLIIVVLGGTDRYTLWVGAVGFGAGMSPLFSAAVAQLHALLPSGVTGSAGGWISAGASSGTLVQLLASQTLDPPDGYRYATVMVALLGFSLAAAAVMAGMWTGVVGWRRAMTPIVFDEDEREGRR